MTTPPSRCARGPHNQEQSEQLCAAPGCRRHPTNGWQLCRDHAAKLGQWLADIEQLYATLDPTLSMATDWNGSGGHALASERSPARLDVLILRDSHTRQWTPDRTTTDPATVNPKSIGPWCILCSHETCAAWRTGRQRDRHDDERDAGSQRYLSVLAVLADWASLIRDERNLTPRSQTATVSSERGVLVAHLDWAMGQGWADDLYREIRQVWGLLKAAHGEKAPRPQARCWVPQEGGSLCGGPIWTDPGAAWCGTCRTSWTGLDLLRISPVLSGAA